MAGIGPTELILILVIVIILFGVGRVSKVFGELGAGIRAFKDGLQGSDKKKNTDTIEANSEEETKDK